MRWISIMLKIAGSRIHLFFPGAVLALVVLCVLAGGCAPGPKKDVPRVRQTATKAELLGILQRNKEELQSIKARIKVRVRTPETRGVQYLEEGFIAIGKPEKIRLRAEKLLAARIEIVSDGKTFWIYLKAPGEKRLYTGLVDESPETASLPLSPKVLIEAMGFSEFPIGEDELYVEDLYDEYVIVILRRGGEPGVAKKVHISAYDLNISRIDYFEPDGKIFAEVFLKDYYSEGGFDLPHEIEARWPFSDSHLRITFKNYKLNEPLSGKLWKFEPPSDLEPVRIGQPPADSTM